jgi:thiosulfate reductase/polysulfide reductase chain A
MWYKLGHGTALCQPVVKPIGESRHANRVFIDLGKRMFPEYYAFKEDVEDCEIELAGVGISVKKAPGK